MNSKVLGYGLAFIAFLVAPYFVYPIFLMTALCFALFACSLNLMIGFAGMVSFGHAAFFGGAAYTAGYVLAVLHWPFELGLVSGILTGALMGLVFGLLATRRSGIDFAMITLALAQMMYFVYLKAPFTGGEDGLQAIPRGRLLGLIDLNDDLTFYYVLFGVVALGFVLIMRAVYSPFGQVLCAIKENEPRAISLGYNVVNYKMLTFVLSTSLAGLAGALKASALGVATLVDVQWTMSGLVLLMVMIGGMKTYFGPVVGAFVIVALQSKLGNLGSFLAQSTHIEWFRHIGTSIPMVTGLIFIVCVLLFRAGVTGTLAMLWRRSFRNGV